MMIREVLIAIILNLSLSLEEKLSLAYDLYDTEDNGYLLYSETIKILKVYSENFEIIISVRCCKLERI